MTVEFEQPAYSVLENVGAAEVCLVKDLQTARSFVVSDITSADGTATGTREILIFRNF